MFVILCMYSVCDYNITYYNNIIYSFRENDLFSIEVESMNQYGKVHCLSTNMYVPHTGCVYIYTLRFKVYSICPKKDRRGNSSKQ